MSISNVKTQMGQKILQKEEIKLRNGSWKNAENNRNFDSKKGKHV